MSNQPSDFRCSYGYIVVEKANRIILKKHIVAVLDILRFYHRDLTVSTFLSEIFLKGICGICGIPERKFLERKKSAGLSTCLIILHNIRSADDNTPLPAVNSCLC
jgi:hypothetical protein